MNEIANESRMRNPNAAANLGPPFNSESGRLAGLRGGRPPSVARQLRRWLRERDPETGKRNAYALAKALGELGIRGNLDAIRTIFDRGPDGPLVTKALTEHIETRRLVISPKSRPAVIDVGGRPNDAHACQTDPDST